MGGHKTKAQLQEEGVDRQVVDDLENSKEPRSLLRTKMNYHGTRTKKISRLPTCSSSPKRLSFTEWTGISWPSRRKRAFSLGTLTRCMLRLNSLTTRQSTYSPSCKS